ncbi:MAG: hypothetical protein PHX98_02870 [Candidatus Moranbacteria bacterium]|nr:hypothetical protein [Candidatus Moranbacteria bacterium]
MEKTNKKIVSLSVFVLAFALTTSLVFAKSDNSKASANSGKSDRTSKSKEIKDFEKPDKAKSNADIYKSNASSIVSSLKKVGNTDKAKGTATEAISGIGGEEGTEEGSEDGAEEADAIEEEIAEEAEEIAEYIVETSENTAGAIEGVESQNKFKKALFGSDYKNLGQLRSSLAHNENQIRKLTRLANKVQTQNQQQNEGLETEIQNQLTLLMQERERIKTVLQDSQETFSILGWFGKLFGLEVDVEVDEDNEEQIEEEVLDVLDGEGTEETGDDSTEGDEGAGEETTGDETIETGDDGTADDSASDEGAEDGTDEGTGETETPAV